MWRVTLGITLVLTLRMSIDFSPVEFSVAYLRLGF